jgi:dienelactone hydrolase
MTEMANHYVNRNTIFFYKSITKVKMKKIIVVFIIVHCSFRLSAQKRAIDTSAFYKWPQAAVNISANISDDGNYTLCTQENTIILSSNSSSWKILLENSHPHVEFTANSKSAVFINKNDSLGILSLGTDIIKYIPKVGSFSLSHDEKKEHLVYITKTSSPQLVIRNLTDTTIKVYSAIGPCSFYINKGQVIIENVPGKSGSKQLIVYNLSTRKDVSFDNVARYSLSKDGKILLVVTTNNKDSLSKENLIWVDLPNRKISQAWSGIRFGAFSFDENSQQLVFIGNRSTVDFPGNSIYFYKAGVKQALDLFSNQSDAVKNEYAVLDVRPSFDLSGNKILFQIKKKEIAKSDLAPSPLKGSPNITLWSYKDEYLQSEQHYLNTNSYFKDNRGIWAAINLKRDNRLIEFSSISEGLINRYKLNDYAIIFGNKHVCDTCNTLFSLYRSSTDSLDQRLITERKNGLLVTLSPDGRFVVWYDPENYCYYSYEIASDKLRNISKSIIVYDEAALKIGNNLNFGIATWAPQNKYIYIYDQFDIWKLDLEGVDEPINITFGYGRKHQITFALADIQGNDAPPFIQDNKELILMGYNNGNKFNGFWKLTPGKKGKLEECSMGAYSYYTPRIGKLGLVDFARGEAPVKAKNANRYLVKRMSATSFPNYYLTDNFRDFTPVTDVHPEKNYNWLTDSLITWKTSDGQLSQGILYKPENFDPAKKYPLIFTYYEKMSDELFNYPTPDFSNDRLNIPYYVSNGYLVFVPDMHYSHGHDGQAVVHTVTSAAKYLVSFPWVDSTKLGLQGHSFGGWETNVLITHSHMFEAACEAAGVVNEVSSFGQLYGGGGTSHRYYEISGNASPYGKGVTPWTHPNQYIENSPIFSIDNVTTPLLMMQGTDDGNVPPAQSIELFLAMRRAGKKVWFLQYANATHNLFGEDAKDYTIRMKQFFDHYLKGAPPPKWMTQGVPYSQRLIDSGLELDSSGALP